MTLHPIPSEFPYISGIFSFLFYQCGTIMKWLHHCWRMLQAQQVVTKLKDTVYSKEYTVGGIHPLQYCI